MGFLMASQCFFYSVCVRGQLFLPLMTQSLSLMSQTGTGGDAEEVKRLDLFSVLAKELEK